MWICSYTHVKCIIQYVNMIIHYHIWSCMIIHVPHVAYVTVQVPWAKTQHQVLPQTIPDPHLVQLLQTEHCAWTRLGSKSRQRQISGWFCQLPLSTQCRNMYNKIEEEPTVLYIYYTYIYILYTYIYIIHHIYIYIASWCFLSVHSSSVRISHQRVSAVRIVRKFTNHWGMRRFLRCVTSNLANRSNQSIGNIIKVALLVSNTGI